MSRSEETTPWICHVCDFRSSVSEGQACDECFKITCAKHLQTAMLRNRESGLYEPKRICVACQFKSQL